jgi:8-oxo-dGTP pyrophosphatase MutT (NUDIX family)
MRVCARAVVVTPDGFVLLMKVGGPARNTWITPGGRVRPGEDRVAALLREMYEETGRTGLEIREEIWVRHGRYLACGRWLEEREHFFFVPSDRFEPTTAGMEDAELRRHLGFRWWSIHEIVGSPESFVPRQMGELLLELRHRGLPLQVLEINE